MPQFIASCAKGLEYLLVDELVAMGMEDVKERLSQVHFSTDWQGAYQSLMWSRFASRIFYPIASFEATNDDTLYQQASIIDWAQHLKPGGTLIVNAQSYRSELSHTQFVSQRIKDAVFDFFRDNDETVPSVSYEKPDLVIHCRIRRNQVTLSIDLAGVGLHQRAYRLDGGGAPIKENLAAALLARAGWPHSSGCLVDPMCGSGTFLIEAAMMALDIAPGLQRDYLGLFGWRQFNESIWQSVCEQAQARKLAKKDTDHWQIRGSDMNPRAIGNAQLNIERAGLSEVIQLNIADLEQLEKTDIPEAGLLIVNPPYSERLGEKEQVLALYAELGRLLKTKFTGWQASVLSPDKSFGHALGIRARKIYKFNNGSLPCELLNLDIDPANFVNKPDQNKVEQDFKSKLTEAGLQLCNRIEKNRQKLKRFLNKENITCYRIYDADIPEFNAAIDVYGDRLYIQEYKAPKTIDAKIASRRLNEITRAAAGIFGLPRSQVFCKQRRQQKGDWQYGKQDEQNETNDNFFKVTEQGRQFWINLVDYIDTGLFLDHRKTRDLIANKAAGKSLLNLFCYTASVSVYAATAGAKSTCNVDMSRTYLNWAKRNFSLNNIDLARHQFERADCLVWLDNALSQGTQFDLIFLDPPTFSNSKKMEHDFDVQSEHPQLIEKCLKLLAPEGELIFSNNFQKFEMQVASSERMQVVEITRQTQSPDFVRNNLHRCWSISKK